MMKVAESLIAWNPGNRPRFDAAAPRIRVGRLLNHGEADWTKPYFCTAGGAYVEVRDFDEKDARLYVMAEFIGIVARDGVPVEEALREFAKIQEFLISIPEDIAAELAAAGGGAA